MFFRVALLISFFLSLAHFSSAQGTESLPPTIGGGFVLDANGNIISQSPSSTGMSASETGATTDPFQYGSTHTMPGIPQQTTVQPSSSGHSPGGKSSYFTGWNDNETTSVGAPDSGKRTDTKIPSDVRDGMFQKITGSALWSPKSGNGQKSFGMTQIELNAMFAFPMFTKESPLLVTPGFSTWLLDQGDSGYSDSLDLYSANCEFRWFKPLMSQYAIEIGATPGYHSAFDYGGGSDAFRVPAHVGAIWNYNPRTKLILGCAYLDRTDYNWLPFGGVIWMPDDLEMRFELLFPNPKISKRIRWWGSAAGNEITDWIYAAGEWAGDCWSLKDDSDRSGSIAYRDYRVMLGYERKAIGYINFAVEVGGLFARNYRDSLYNEDHSLDSGFFLRVKAIY